MKSLLSVYKMRGMRYTRSDGIKCYIPKDLVYSITEDTSGVYIWIRNGDGHLPNPTEVQETFDEIIERYEK